METLMTPSGLPVPLDVEESRPVEGIVRGAVADDRILVSEELGLAFVSGHKGYPVACGVLASGELDGLWSEADSGTLGGFGAESLAKMVSLGVLEQSMVESVEPWGE